MTLSKQLEFLEELIDEFQKVDRRMKGFSDYDGSYMDTAANLEEVAESIHRLIGLEK